MTHISIPKKKPLPGLRAVVGRLENVTVATVSAAAGVTPAQAERWLNKQFYLGALERTGVRQFQRTERWKELNA